MDQKYWRFALGVLCAIASYKIAPLFLGIFLRALAKRLKKFVWISDVNQYMSTYLSWLLFALLLYLDAIFLFQFKTVSKTALVLRYFLAIPLILVTACARYVITNALLRYFSWDSHGEGYENRVFIVRELTNFLCAALIGVEIFYFFLSSSELAAFILVEIIFFGALLLFFAVFSMLKNVASGLFLIFAEPLRIGHLCHVKGIAGIVEQISLNRTTIRRRDGAIVFVPNGAFANFPQANRDLVMDTFAYHVRFRICGNVSSKKLDAVVQALQSELSEMERNVSVYLRAMHCIEIQIAVSEKTFAAHASAQTEIHLQIIRSLQQYLLPGIRVY